MRGTMRERPEGSGSWQLRVFVGRDEQKRPIQRSKTFRGGKRAAQTVLAEFVAEIAQQTNEGAPLLDSRTTVDQLLDRWLKFVTPDLEPSTIRGYQDCVRRIKASSLASVPVAKLTSQHLDRAYRAWIEDEDHPLSPTTVRNTHVALGIALHQAVRWDLIPRAVTELAKPPPLRQPPMKAIEPATVQKLVSAADENEYPILAAAIALAAVTGCRRGELCGLRWSDVELLSSPEEDLQGVLHVRRAVKYGLKHEGERRGVVARDTKTHQDRKVALDPVTITILMNHRVRVEEWAEKACVEIRPDGYILSFDPSGSRPLPPDTLTAEFIRLTKKLGLRIRFHDLRHFTATQLLGAGIDPRTVAGRLGHRDPSVTMRVYAAFLEEKDREAANIMGRLITPAPKALPAAG